MFPPHVVSLPPRAFDSSGPSGEIGDLAKHFKSIQTKLATKLPFPMFGIGPCLVKLKKGVDVALHSSEAVI